MKILGIDSSGLVASVALVEDDLLIAEYSTQFKVTHSQTLLPMLDEIKSRLNLQLDSIDGIAVAAGPGSFTGLRIGSATVKGLGLALQKPIIPVPTLEALAYNLWGTSGLVCPIMDARRNQVYTGIYSFVQSSDAYALQMVTELEQSAVAFEVLAEELNRRKQPVTFLGDGVPVFADQMKDLLQIPYFFAPPQNNRQRAGSVAALGALYYIEGKVQHANEHAPEYLRLSQAEREKMEKQG